MQSLVFLWTNSYLEIIESEGDFRAHGFFYSLYGFVSITSSPLIGVRHELLSLIFLTKLSKCPLKSWTTQMLSKMLEDVQIAIQVSNANECLHEKERECKKSILKYWEEKEYILKQKSRDQLISLGDSNQGSKSGSKPLYRSRQNRSVPDGTKRVA